MEVSYRLAFTYVFAAFAAGFLLRDDLPLTTSSPQPTRVASAETTGTPPTQQRGVLPQAQTPSQTQRPQGLFSNASQTFTCRWSAGRRPYTVSIRIAGNRATRDDGGNSYTVVDQGNRVIVMLVNRSGGGSFAFQTIDTRTGDWTDYVLTGSRFNRVRGGRCRPEV